MPRACEVCIHEERAGIESALAAGSPAPRIAALYRVSADSVLRHARNHLGAVLASGRQEEAAARGATLLDQIRTQQERAEKLLLLAVNKGDLRAAAAFLDSGTKLLSLLGRATKELETGGATVNVNLRMSAEWITIRTRLLSALAPYPEARAAAAAALAEAGDE